MDSLITVENMLGNQMGCWLIVGQCETCFVESNRHVFRRIERLVEKGKLVATEWFLTLTFGRAKRNEMHPDTLKQGRSLQHTN